MSPFGIIYQYNPPSARPTSPLPTDFSSARSTLPLPSSFPPPRPSSSLPTFFPSPILHGGLLWSPLQIKTNLRLVFFEPRQGLECDDLEYLARIAEVRENNNLPSQQKKNVDETSTSAIPVGLILVASLVLFVVVALAVWKTRRTSMSSVTDRAHLRIVSDMVQAHTSLTVGGTNSQLF